MMKITLAFDADDTLWHNERIFLSTKEVYKGLLSRYHDYEWIEERLDATEVKNIRRFGYGVKGFTLSMVETAVELTEGRISGKEIGEIVELGKEMLNSPVHLLEGVRETLDDLHGNVPLMLVTKGDLFDQETKIARSGLSEYFDAIEIISQKATDNYVDLLGRNSLVAENFAMVGNSLKSDVLPVLQIGGYAAHLPYETEWFHERVDGGTLEKHEFEVLSKITDVPDWVASL